LFCNKKGIWVAGWLVERANLSERQRSCGAKSCNKSSSESGSRAKSQLGRGGSGGFLLLKSLSCHNHLSYLWPLDFLSPAETMLEIEYFFHQHYKFG
jgi:hypothetical protein